MRRTEERSLEKSRKNLNKETKDENRTRNKSRIHGITLIALVITIIVLLILAGVTISIITGDNGIIGEAAKARTNTEKSRNRRRNKYNDNKVSR